MGKNILITGGAGFIGSHLADELLAHGYHVRVLDNLTPQVHGPNARRPRYLDEDVEFIWGDIRNPATVQQALEHIDAVYHLASMVGVGQSMYEMAAYTSHNNLGTATLLERLVKRPVERLVVASSMSLYGEGLYQDPQGNIVEGDERPWPQLRNKDWELRTAAGEVLRPLPTPESKKPCLASVYALSKFDQERMSLIIGKTYQIPVVALRFFNVFGTRQALSNPYTGVLAIFAARLLNGKPPLIYEDGYQQRDFVSVHDVAQACRLALEAPAAAGRVFNVGSGSRYTIWEIARRLAAALNKTDIEPQVTGTYRAGDIRHCFADITAARQVLGYEPRIELSEGLVELVAWLDGQGAADGIEQASAELAMRGLTI